MAGRSGVATVGVAFILVVGGFAYAVPTTLRAVAGDDPTHGSVIRSAAEAHAPGDATRPLSAHVDFPLVPRGDVGGDHRGEIAARSTRSRSRAEPR